MDFLADTGFLIDLWRESRQPGAATHFARTNAGKQVGICWIVEGEFLGGSVLADHNTAVVSAFLGHYSVVHSNRAIVRQYSELFASLRRQNRLIGPNDLWIAATALSLGLPLLTRNADEFERVSELEIVDYTTALA